MTVAVVYHETRHPLLDVVMAIEINPLLNTNNRVITNFICTMYYK